MDWLQSVWEQAQRGAMWLWSVITGSLMYLAGGPSAALSALFIVMLLDLVCKIVSLSVNSGGFFKAINAGHIRSSKMFSGTAIKFFGYYALAIVAYQLKCAGTVEIATTVAELLASAIYMFLLLVEGTSVFEHLRDAGLTTLTPLQRRFEREIDKIAEGDDYPINKGGDSW